MKAIVNANLILEEGIVFDGVVLVENGLIAPYGETGSLRFPQMRRFLTPAVNTSRPALSISITTAAAVSHSPF